MKRNHEIWNRFKPVLFAITPIVICILLVELFFFDFQKETLTKFLISAAVFIVGQVIFVFGIDKALVPMGEYVGNSIDKNGKFFVLVIFGLIFGTLSSVAEPDLQVFVNQTASAGFEVPPTILLFGAGFGFGFFLALALYRFVTKIPFRFLIMFCYAFMFVMAIFVSTSAFAISVDIGPTTTGIVASPFILALGTGAANGRGYKASSREDNFGLVAMASLGPVVVCLLLAMIYKGRGAAISSGIESLPLWLDILKNVTLSFLPLLAVFFIFELIFIKIPWRELKKLIVGSVITFVGFYVYLFSIEYGFVGMGKAFGGFLAGTGNILLPILICSLFGFFICFSEPTIRVLGAQVEKVTNGNIKQKLVIATIAVSLVVGVALSVLKIAYNINIWWFAAIIFGIAFILLFVVPPTFSAIAFDSSGISTGTMTIAFLFPIMIGFGGNLAEIDTFGVIGIMTMTPIVVMQLLGLAYGLSLKAEGRRDKRMLVGFSRTIDKYSNITNIEKRYNEINGGRHVK